MLHPQDGLLVEFLEILGESDVPIFSNMTADNLPDDNMVKHFFQKNILKIVPVSDRSRPQTISCDISASISFQLRTSRPIRSLIC